MKEKQPTPQKPILPILIEGFKNGLELTSTPLTFQQQKAINSLKGKMQKPIIELLLAKRDEGKMTTMEDVMAYIHFESRERAYQNIVALNKTSIKHVGLSIHAVKIYDRELDRYKTFYCLLTDDELAQMSQNNPDKLSKHEETEEFFTLKEIGQAINLFDERTLLKRLNYARKIDPGINPLHLDPRRPRKHYFEKEDYEKLVELMSPQRKKGQGNGSKTQDNNPFRGEYSARTILGKSPEQIREEAKMDSATVILSHLAYDAMDDLSKNPRELLENLLPRYNHVTKTKLESVIRESPKQFVVDSLTKVLEAFWSQDPNHAKSANEMRILTYCLKLSKKGYTMEKIVEIVHDHFLDTDFATYAVAH